MTSTIESAIDLDNINGIKPKTALKDGETTECVSASSHNIKYTIKRTWDHYYCSCPAWRNAGGPVNGRTCKHLKSILGNKYEEARLAIMNPPGDNAGPKSKKPAAKKRATKAAAPRKRKTNEDEVESPAKRSRGKAPATSKKSKAKPDFDDAEEIEEEEEEEEEEVAAGTRVSSRNKTTVNALKNKLFKPLLAEKWDLEKGRDPTGWQMSEKLDGVRAYWNGERFLSREGNPFYAPAWFIEGLPKDITLDGELFTSRGGFQDCVSIVKCANRPNNWKAVTYQIFDCPSMGDEKFEDRISFLESYFSGDAKIEWINVLPHTVCKSREHVFEMLDEITASQGEGVMLREPGSPYHQGRSKSLLKVKRFFDADAIVRGHEKGSGKNSDCVGALKCEMLDENGVPTGKMFKVGSGLTDTQRRSPPKAGVKIIYRYQELTRDGVPRFPSYGGVRVD
ncbi:hypothetical protein RUND412_008276 [Rhizina undulata]